VSIDTTSLVELRDRLVGALAAVDQALAAGEPATPARPEFLPLKRAAAVAGRDERTIRRWCERYRIGEKVAGRWSVDRARLEALLKVL